MNTKIIAIFLASMVAMAVAVPMVMGDTAQTSASVGMRPQQLMMSR